MRSILSHTHYIRAHHHTRLGSRSNASQEVSVSPTVEGAVSMDATVCPTGPKPHTTTALAAPYSATSPEEGGAKGSPLRLPRVAPSVKR